MNTEKENSLEKTVSDINKMFGKDSIMRMGGALSTYALESIPTGVLNLDRALGIGGFPKGRIIEIYGPESSGKTTLALIAAVEAQKQGSVAYVDVEHALDPTYMQALGIKLKDLLIAQPDSGEEALEITEKLVRSSAISLVVVDSVAALVSKAEIDGAMGDSHVGLQARLMSQALRKLTPAVSQSSTCVIFINQIRNKIGTPAYMSPETTSGGLALKFYASIRMEIRKIETLKKGDEIIGSRTRIKIVKNKVAPPYRTAEFDIFFGKGISKVGVIFDMAVEENIIEKAASWFMYKEHKLGQGKDNAMAYLQENKLLDEITTRLTGELNKESDK